MSRLTLGTFMRSFNQFGDISTGLIDLFTVQMQTHINENSIAGIHFIHLQVNAAYTAYYAAAA